MRPVRPVVGWAVLLAGTTAGCGGPEPTPGPAPSPPTAAVVEPTAATPPTPPPVTATPPTARDMARVETAPPPARPFSPPTLAWRPTAPPTGAMPAATPVPPAPDSAAKDPPMAAKVDDGKPKEKEWPKDVDGRNLPEWMADLGSPDGAVRETAVRVLPAFGPEARKVAAKRVHRMISEDFDPGVRMAAMTAAGQLGLESREEIKPMVAALNRALAATMPGSALRLYATQAIGSYGQDAAEAVPFLEKIHTDPWWETRKAVAQALGRIGAPVYDDPPAIDPRTKNPVAKKPANDKVKPILVSMAKNDRSAAVRLEAVSSLIGMGPPIITTAAEYATAIKPVQDLITDRLAPQKGKVGPWDLVEPDKGVQIWLNVLDVMTDDRKYQDALPKIAGYLRVPSPVTRAQALTAVATLGPKAATPAVLEALKDALGYEEEILIAGALNCLTGMGKDAAGLVPDVEKLRERTTLKEMKTMAGETIDVLTGKKTAEQVAKERAAAAEKAAKEAEQKLKEVEKKAKEVFASEPAPAPKPKE